MTVIQAARTLGLSPAGIRRRIERGEMKAELISPRLYLIPAEEVERWQQLGKLKPGPRPGSQKDTEEQH
jgi:excisionase family DNA binding protein